jgi:hypothetical protein
VELRSRDGRAAAPPTRAAGVIRDGRQGLAAGRRATVGVEPMMARRLAVGLKNANLSMKSDGRGPTSQEVKMKINPHNRLITKGPKKCSQ